MDIDSISPQVIGYWAIKTLLEKDLLHLESQNEELAQKLEVADAGQTMHTLSEAARKKLMMEYGLNKQSIQTVSDQMDQVTKVYNKAVNTAMWEKRFKAEGIETEEQKREYVAKYQDKVAQQQASTKDMIAKWDQQLRDEGVTDEKVRLAKILEMAEQEEARLQTIIERKKSSLSSSEDLQTSE